MSAPSKLALFTAGLAVVFTAALGVGAAVGPTTDPPAVDHGGHETTTTMASR